MIGQVARGKRCRKRNRLTLSLLPLPQDGVQPLLLVLGVLGHADEPLVLGRVVDLPAVGHGVVVAVVVRWRHHAALRQYIVTPLRRYMVSAGDVIRHYVVK